MVDTKIKLAKQGNSQAIACLIEDVLKSEKVIKSEIKDGCLKLVVETLDVSDQHHLVTKIRELIINLEIEGLTKVELSGQNSGSNIPQWQEEFTINNLSAIAELTNEQQKTDSTKARKNEFLETLQTFDFASVVPYKQVFDPNLYNSNMVRLLLCFGLFPWMISIYASTNNSSLQDIAWILGIYYAFIWGIVLYNLIKPAQFSLKLALQCVCFTAFIGIPLLLIIQKVPPFNLFYLAIKSSNIISQLVGFILGVGLLEEICKALPVYLFLLNKGKLNEPLTPAFYGAMSGLGFAIAEGAHYSLVYATNLVGGNLTLTGHVLFTTVRFISLPLIHAIWAGIVGYFLGLAAINPSRKNPIIFIGIVIAAVLHGLYDVFASSLIGLAILAFSILLFVTYLRRSKEMVKEMRQAEAISQKVST